MARLVYMDPEGRQQTLTLDAQTPQIVIGRHPECDLVSDDTSVSRRHCVITYELGHHRVSDLGAANGTLVNDTRVSRRNLVSRDIVRCGNLLLQFFDEPEISSAPPVVLPPLPRRSPSGDGLTETSSGTSIMSLMRAEISRLNDRIQVLEHLNSGQAERLGDLQQDLAVAGDRVDAALGQSSEYEVEARELREQLWRAEELIRARSAALDAREAEAAALRRRVEAAPRKPSGRVDELRRSGPSQIHPDGSPSVANGLAAALERLAVAEGENLAARARIEQLVGALQEASAHEVRAQALEGRLLAVSAQMAALAAERNGDAGLASGGRLPMEPAGVSALQARAEEAESALARFREERLTATSTRMAEVATVRARLTEVESELAHVRASQPPMGIESSGSTLDALRDELANLQRKLGQANATIEEIRRDDARLKGALSEAREEAKAAGQSRKALREAQAEFDRLRGAASQESTMAGTPAGFPDEGAADLQAALEAAQSEARLVPELRERLSAMESRARRTEEALAEAEGRAHEAQMGLLQVREAERSAQVDRATSERHNQMNVKLAAVTRRAQQAEEQAATARRLEVKVQTLEKELASARELLDETELERDHASGISLELLAEKRQADNELSRYEVRLGQLEGGAAAMRAAKATWPAWMDDHLEMLNDLVAQLGADMGRVQGQWTGLGRELATSAGTDFVLAVESALAGSQSVAEATRALCEAMDTLRQRMEPNGRSPD